MDETPPAAALRDGDRSAFSTWISVLQERVFRYATRKLGDREDALDAVQETFVAAFDGRSRLPDSTGKQAAWLLGIASHKVHDSLRRRYRQRARQQSMPVEVASHVDPAAEAEGRQQADRVRTAVEALPEPYREALVLATIDGLKYLEVAAIQGCPVGTVRSRVAKGRQLLRAELAKAGSP